MLHSQGVTVNVLVNPGAIQQWVGQVSNGLPIDLVLIRIGLPMRARGEIQDATAERRIGETRQRLPGFIESDFCLS